ncbi:MAG TPA: 30S ribosomal protein S14 [Flavobacteriales bacterium]|nr:30S ribosomal protein S14 [Flavobacteriales bacterium]
MAKESMKARDKKRARLVDQYAERRAALKKALLAGDVDAMKKLQELPKNSSKVRKRNRCQLTGRPRGYMRQFGVSRIVFRDMALNGKIPGVTKASW